MAMLRKEHPILVNGHKVNVRNPFLKKLASPPPRRGFSIIIWASGLAMDCCARCLSGDVMAKLPFGGMFVVEDVEREQQRFDLRETVTAGPIFGRKTFPAAGGGASGKQPRSEYSA